MYLQLAEDCLRGAVHPLMMLLWPGFSGRKERRQLVVKISTVPVASCWFVFVPAEWLVHAALL